MNLHFVLYKEQIIIPFLLRNKSLFYTIERSDQELRPLIIRTIPMAKPRLAEPGL